MRRVLGALLLTACLCLLCACGDRQPAPAANCTIWVAADLHYLAPELNDRGPFLTRLLANGDGKLSLYSEELTEAFLAEAAAEKPDALILLGDLTFNGALASHRALAEKLAALENSGVPVYVLPGNHDVFCSGAAAFEGEKYRPVPSAESADSREIYSAFGYGEAIAADRDSLSILCELDESTWLLLLDTNTDHDPCGLSDSSLHWVEQQLKAARARGVTVLAAGHQNLMAHSLFVGGYVIRQADALRALLSRYGVRLFLSGHMHIQTLGEADGVTEIVTSALSVWPCQYGVVRARDGRLSYETALTDVAAWARAQGSADENLLDFSAYGEEYLDQNSRRQAEPLAALGYGEEQVQMMTDYLCAMNRAYVSGDLREIAALDPDGSLLENWAEGDSLTGWYLSGIRDRVGNDYRSWTEKGT